MRKIVILMLIIIIGNRLYAQQRAIVADVKYATEFQYNFKESCNWVNLLSLNAQLSTEAIGAWRNGFLDLELISIYRTAKERILDDWQTFSNIDEQNMPFGISMLGYTQKVGKTDLFFGIRNVNRDYFIAPYTSLFTNSSCGIYPTISANYPLANYPLSAMCFHAEYGINDNWHIKNSLYNGVAYESLAQVFTINPQRDGLFNMTKVSYTQHSKYDGIYSLGSAISTRMPVYREDGEGQLISKTKIEYTLWANAEQCIYDDDGRGIGVLAQCSFAPSSTCSEYYGVGLLLNGCTTRSKIDQLGVFINRSTFDNKNEIALELTWKCRIISNLDIQPAFHLIKNRGNTVVAGLFRISYVLNFK